MRARALVSGIALLCFAPAATALDPATAATRAAVLAADPSTGGRAADKAVADRSEQTGVPERAARDAEIESFLSAGRIVKTEEIGSGISRPLRVTLEWQGRTMRAAFKTIDRHITGMTRWESRGPEFNFTDSYKYERAAYLLDRHLGLYMVPVVVIREIEGQQGALTEWVSGAVNDLERRQRGLEPPDLARFMRQRSLMELFDALIWNSDRTAGNQLITTDDWKLHAIDHSRSFRLEKTLPELFAKTPIRLPRELLSELESLEAKQLRALFGDLVSKARVRALIARRDRILEKVRRDREQFGDRAVFDFGNDTQPAQVPAPPRSERSPTKRPRLAREPRAHRFTLS